MQNAEFQLQHDYPWIKAPLISSAPMRLISGPALAVEVSRGGGLGFLGAGSDVSNLSSLLDEVADLVNSAPISDIPTGILPIGIGFLNWGADLETVIRVLRSSALKPAAVWFFAPRDPADLVEWTTRIREVTHSRTKIWVQVGTSASAVLIAQSCRADVLVVQGADAGGHGLAQSASIISLLPETADALTAAGLREIPLIATGGIMDGRGVAAALMLGASGVCLGTRFLASQEAKISDGYKKAIIDATDGGCSTVRTSVYDKLRGTTQWPSGYNGRGLINKSFRDWQAGIPEDVNQKLHDQALQKGDLGWGKDEGRLTTYAGTGVGLVSCIQPAREIVHEIQAETSKVLLDRNRIA